MDNSSLSADTKALLYDIVRITVKVGETVISIGRRIFEIASALISKFPNLTIGTLVGLVVATVIGSTLGSITIAGAAPFAGLAALLSKLVILLGVGKGFIDDLRNGAVRLMRTSLWCGRGTAPYAAQRPRHSARAAVRFALK